jgi:AraC-type transcriptional regulator/helix-turn-helix protein
MQAIPLARASLLLPVFDLLDQWKMELPERLQHARALLHDPAALIPLAMGGALFEEAVRCSGRADIGFRAGCAVSILDYSDWGSVIAQVATVGDFVTALVTETRRFNSGSRFWAVRSGDELWLHQHFSSQLVHGRTVAIELALTMLLKAIRLATGPDWRPIEIHLEGAPPPHAGELASLASKRVRFEQPYMALVIPAQLLVRPFPPQLVAAHPLERGRVPSTSFAESIRTVVEVLVRVGSAELSIAAEATLMSERSLQRRLAECGLSFTRIVEDVRFDSARRLLRDPGVKIVEVSAELGYTDSANFTRAFRRWSGVSPQAYRRSA